MTTIAIQQRAGGDTVRALGELAATLDARKDLRREIKTLLSGVVFTSYVVAGIGGATILMINAISPGVTQDMTGSALGLAGPRRGDDPVGDRVRADPEDDEDRCLRCRGSSAGLTVLCLMVGLAAVPMLRDQGPVERLGGRIGGVREPNARRSVIAKLVSRARGAARAAAGAEPARVAARRARAPARLRGPAGQPHRPELHRAQGGARAAARDRRRRPAPAARLERDLHACCWA